jgi:hypothetical protein
LKQAAVAQRQRSGSEAAKLQALHLQLIDLKRPPVAQRQLSSQIAATSFTANQFEATSGSAAAAKQPNCSHFIYSQSI